MGVSHETQQGDPCSCKPSQSIVIVIEAEGMHFVEQSDSFNPVHNDHRLRETLLSVLADLDTITVVTESSGNGGRMRAQIVTQDFVALLCVWRHTYAKTAQSLLMARLRLILVNDSKGSTCTHWTFV